jgi:hypothetical protein
MTATFLNLRGTHAWLLAKMHFVFFWAFPCSTPFVFVSYAQSDEADVDGNGIAKSFRQTINSCWQIPPDAIGSGVSVVIGFDLDRKGTLIGTPKVIGGTRENSFFQMTAKSAVSAIQSCQPFSFLPSKQYKMWNHIEWKFAP